MTRLTQWLNDWRWATNMVRARRWRRKLTLSQRDAFDEALRPTVGVIGDDRVPFVYPAAVYYVTIDDVMRAMRAAREAPKVRHLPQRAKARIPETWMAK